MKKSFKKYQCFTRIICAVAIFFGSISSLSAQDTLSYCNALNFPTKKVGISIGNSRDFSGLRINFADQNVKKINGINITFWFRKWENNEAIVNGISVGIIPQGGPMRPINLGVLGTASSENMSGLTMAGGYIGTGGNLNGLSVSGFGTGVGRAINGLACSVFTVYSTKSINGMAVCPIYVSGKIVFRGFALTGGYFYSGELKGVAVAGYANTIKTNGVTIALYNRTKELHGIQFGLLNYAGNNPKGLKMLPLINLHRRIKKEYKYRE